MVTLPRYFVLLALIAVQRLAELLVSSHNARKLRARGAIEFGRGHYPAIVAMHVLFLPACALEAMISPPPFPWLARLALVGLIAAQALRYWAIFTLGGRWTTRVLVEPGRPPVTRGPYRFLRHPNYLAVAIEMACIPLVYGCIRTALLFSAANAVLMTLRIPVEDDALRCSTS
jgi:methyltransferase